MHLTLWILVGLAVAVFGYVLVRIGNAFEREDEERRRSGWGCR